MLQRLKERSGFTLIELLIVIVIIGILAGIVIGLTGASARKKANDAQAKADMHELQNALEQYFTDQNPNAYPAQATWQADLVAGEVLKAAKVAPTGSYVYTPGAGNTSYTLEYTLENTNDSGANVVAGVYTLTEKQ